VVGVFVGFDDNRSLGQGETGTQAAVPIFISFMKEALKDQPAEEFKAPTNAKFATIRGVREAFRPGTEPKVAVAPAFAPRSGPVPYEQAFPPAGAPPAGQPPPPPPKKGDDLSGLY
jgi:penicillin-binding protein 1A